MNVAAIRPFAAVLLRLSAAGSGLMQNATAEDIRQHDPAGPHRGRSIRIAYRRGALGFTVQSRQPYGSVRGKNVISRFRHSGRFRHSE
jgi:hypothetical protein